MEDIWNSGAIQNESDEILKRRGICAKRKIAPWIEVEAKQKEFAILEWLPQVENVCG